MNDSNSDSAFGQEIEQHEKELKELLTRVMKEPLEPVSSGVKQLQGQVESTASELPNTLLASVVVPLDRDIRKLKEEIEERLDKGFDEGEESIAGICDEMATGFREMREILTEHKDQFLSASANTLKKVTQSLEEIRTDFSDGFSSANTLLDQQAKQIQRNSDQLSDDFRSATERMAALEARYGRLQISAVFALVLATLALLLSLYLWRGSFS